MTQKEFDKKKQKIEQRNKQLEMQEELRNLKKIKSSKNKKPSTSKLILLIVFIICIQILIFSEYMAIKTGDTSYMYALIGVPAALIPTILGYYHKSRFENPVGGITYDMAMSQITPEDNVVTFDENEAVG